MQAKNRIKQTPGTIMFRSVSSTIIVLLSLICVIPFWMIVVGSFSSEADVVVNGYSLFPHEFSLDAYQVVFKSGGRIFRAYGVTIIVTVVGTVFGVLLTAMGGFVLSRKDFKHRNQFALFFYFTTLFSGGMIPFYMVVTKVLYLKDTLWALILPGLTSVFYIFLFRNFLKAIPDELMESARIDGAGDMRIFLQIAMPVAKPAIATIALFTALAYWNDWYRSLLFIQDENKYALQYLLYRMLLDASDAAASAGDLVIERMPSETMKLATAVITTGPVLLFYPFAQKYFVGGLIVGSVKG